MHNDVLRRVQSGGGRYGLAIVLSTISGNSMLACDVSNFLDVHHHSAGIGKTLDEDAARAIINLLFETRQVFRIGPSALPSQTI